MNTHRRTTPYYGWWIVGASVLVGLYVGGIVVYGFTAIFEPIVLEFGWSYAVVSFAASLRGVESGLLEPVVGRLVDHWGPRRLIAFGGLFTTAGLLLLSNTTSLITFYGSFALLAIGMSCCGPTVLVTAVANWFRARQAFATGVALSGFGLGGLILPLMVALIAQYGWRVTFEMLAIGAAVLILPLSLVFRKQPDASAELPRGAGRSPSATTHVPAHFMRDGLAETPTGIRNVTRTRFFWLLTLAFTLHSAIVITVVTHVMPYLSDIGLERMSAGVVATAIPVLSVLGRLGLGLLGDRSRESNTSMCGIVRNDVTGNPLLRGSTNAWNVDARALPAAVWRRIRRSHCSSSRSDERVLRPRTVWEHLRPYSGYQRPWRYSGPAGDRLGL